MNGVEYLYTVPIKIFITTSDDFWKTGNFSKVQTPLIQFVVELLYNERYNTLYNNSEVCSKSLVIYIYEVQKRLTNTPNPQHLDVSGFLYNLLATSPQ